MSVDPAWRHGPEDHDQARRLQALYDTHVRAQPFSSEEQKQKQEDPVFLTSRDSSLWMLGELASRGPRPLAETHINSANRFYSGIGEYTELQTFSFCMKPRDVEYPLMKKKKRMEQKRQGLGQKRSVVDDLLESKEHVLPVGSVFDPPCWPSDPDPNHEYVHEHKNMTRESIRLILSHLMPMTQDEILAQTLYMREQPASRFWFLVCLTGGRLEKPSKEDPATGKRVPLYSFQAEEDDGVRLQGTMYNRCQVFLKFELASNPKVHVVVPFPRVYREGCTGEPMILQQSDWDHQSSLTPEQARAMGISPHNPGGYIIRPRTIYYLGSPGTKAHNEIQIRPSKEGNDEAFLEIVTSNPEKPYMDIQIQIKLTRGSLTPPKARLQSNNSHSFYPGRRFNYRARRVIMGGTRGGRGGRGAAPGGRRRRAAFALPSDLQRTPRPVTPSSSSSSSASAASSSSRLIASSAPGATGVGTRLPGKKKARRMGDRSMYVQFRAPREMLTPSGSTEWNEKVKQRFAVRASQSESDQYIQDHMNDLHGPSRSPEEQQDQEGDAAEVEVEGDGDGEGENEVDRGQGEEEEEGGGGDGEPPPEIPWTSKIEERVRAKIGAQVDKQVTASRWGGSDRDWGQCMTVIDQAISSYCTKQPTSKTRDLLRQNAASIGMVQMFCGFGVENRDDIIALVRGKDSDEIFDRYSRMLHWFVNMEQNCHGTRDAWLHVGMMRSYMQDAQDEKFIEQGQYFFEKWIMPVLNSRSKSREAIARACKEKALFYASLVRALLRYAVGLDPETSKLSLAHKYFPVMYDFLAVNTRLGVRNLVRRAGERLVSLVGEQMLEQTPEQFADFLLELEPSTLWQKEDFNIEFNKFQIGDMGNAKLEGSDGVLQRVEHVNLAEILAKQSRTLNLLHCPAMRAQEEEHNRHPSSTALLCPIETPNGDKAGRTLQRSLLARIHTGASLAVVSGLECLLRCWSGGRMMSIGDQWTLASSLSISEFYHRLIESEKKGTPYYEVRIDGFHIGYTPDPAWIQELILRISTHPASVPTDREFAVVVYRSKALINIRAFCGRIVTPVFNTLRFPKAVRQFLEDDHKRVQQGWSEPLDSPALIQAAVAMVELTRLHGGIQYIDAAQIEQSTIAPLPLVSSGPEDMSKLTRVEEDKKEEALVDKDPAKITHGRKQASMVMDPDQDGKQSKTKEQTDFWLLNPEGIFSIGVAANPNKSHTSPLRLTGEAITKRQSTGMTTYRNRYHSATQHLLLHGQVPLIGTPVSCILNVFPSVCNANDTFKVGPENAEDGKTISARWAAAGALSRIDTKRYEIATHKNEASCANEIHSTAQAQRSMEETGVQLSSHRDLITHFLPGFETRPEQLAALLHECHSSHWRHGDRAIDPWTGMASPGSIHLPGDTLFRLFRLPRKSQHVPEHEEDEQEQEEDEKKEQEDRKIEGLLTLTRRKPSSSTTTASDEAVLALMRPTLKKLLSTRYKRVLNDSGKIQQLRIIKNKQVKGHEQLSAYTSNTELLTTACKLTSGSNNKGLVSEPEALVNMLWTASLGPPDTIHNTHGFPTRKPGSQLIEMLETRFRCWVPNFIMQTTGCSNAIAMQNEDEFNEASLCHNAFNPITARLLETLLAMVDPLLGPGSFTQTELDVLAMHHEHGIPSTSSACETTTQELDWISSSSSSSDFDSYPLHTSSSSDEDSKHETEGGSFREWTVCVRSAVRSVFETAAKHGSLLSTPQSKWSSQIEEALEKRIDFCHLLPADDQRLPSVIQGLIQRLESRLRLRRLQTPSDSQEWIRALTVGLRGESIDPDLDVPLSSGRIFSYQDVCRSKTTQESRPPQGAYASLSDEQLFCMVKRLTALDTEEAYSPLTGARSGRISRGFVATRLVSKMPENQVRTYVPSKIDPNGQLARSVAHQKSHMEKDAEMQHGVAYYALDQRVQCVRPMNRFYHTTCQNTAIGQEHPSCLTCNNKLKAAAVLNASVNLADLATPGTAEYEDLERSWTEFLREAELLPEQLIRPEPSQFRRYVTTHAFEKIDANEEGLGIEFRRQLTRDNPILVPTWSGF